MRHSVRKEEAFLRQAAAEYAQMEGRYLCQEAAKAKDTMEEVPPEWNADCIRLIEEYYKRQARIKRMKMLILGLCIAGLVLVINIVAVVYG